MVQVAVKKMKRKFYDWNECVNLREVKACPFMLQLVFKHLDLVGILSLLQLVQF